MQINFSLLLIHKTVQQKGTKDQPQMINYIVIAKIDHANTVACIIVRRLLISVHKWQFSGMADTHEYWSQHDAHLVYLPIFHGLNLIIFS